MIDVEAHLDDVGRFERDVEAALYFCTVEALTNSDRHAPGSTVRLSLTRTDADVVLRIADEGALADDGHGGRGLTNMRDRVEALGGGFSFTGGPDGTVVAISVPVSGVRS